MFKYTVDPNVRKEYLRLHRKDWSSGHNYLCGLMPPSMYLQQGTIAWYLSKEISTYTFYSNKKRMQVPVKGCLIPVHGIFVEEKIKVD